VPMKPVLLYISLLLAFTISGLRTEAQVIFYEPFDEPNFSTSGVDNVGGIQWVSAAPGSVAVDDYFEVRTGMLEGRDICGDFGPEGTWQTMRAIDVSSCGSIIIDFYLQESGDMESCTDPPGCGCGCLDWFEFNYNLDAGGWIPLGTNACPNTCAGNTYVKTGNLNTGDSTIVSSCIQGPFDSLELYIGASSWAANEYWRVDEIRVSCGANSGLDSSITLCSGSPAVNLFDYLGGSPDSSGTWTGPSALPGGFLATFTPGTHTAGVYEYVTGIAPCTDTAQISVSVSTLPNPGSDVTITVCSSYNSMDLLDSLGAGTSAGGTWSGPSVLANGDQGTFDPSTNVSGVYTYYVGTAPCWDSSQVTITVGQQPNLVITNPAPICQPDSINLAAPAVTAGTTPGGLTYSYYYDAAATMPLPGSWAKDSSYFYYIVGQNPAMTKCADTSFVNVTINPKPALVVTDPPAACDPGTVDLTAPTVTAGSNLFGAGLSYFQDAGATIPVGAPAAVSDSSWTYYIVATTFSAPACSDTAPVNVTITGAPTLVITDPAAVCQPGTIDFTAAAITAGSTLNGATLSYHALAPPAPAIASPTAVGDSSWTYFILATTPTVPACTDTATVNVTIFDKPDLVIADPAAVCQPNTIDLTAAAITTGSTLFGSTLSYFTDVAGANPVGTPSSVSDSSWTYYIIASTPTVPACTDTAAVNITIQPKPDLVISDPAGVCSPATIDLTAPAVTAGSNLFGGSLSYFQNAGASIPVATPSAVADSSWTYYVVATTASVPACSDTTPVNVTINDKPILNTIDPAGVCQPNMIDLTAPAITAGSTLLGSSLSYWKDNAATIPLGSPASVADSSRTYYIVATTATVPACSDTASVNVTIQPKPDLVITDPTAICQPGTIDLTTAPITAGSTLHGGTLTYFQNSAATIVEGSPTSVSDSSWTYYIVATTASVPSCSDTAAVNVTIHGTPSLTITNPSPACKPGTIDLTAASVTSGSSLFGASLSYFQNASATLPVASPNAVADSAYTYYVVATTPTVPACADTAPIAVSFHDKPVLVTNDPAALCQFNTIDLTAATITTGSTLLGSTLTYFKDAALTNPVAAPSIVGDSSWTYFILASTPTIPACTDTESVDVTIHPKPVLNITPPTPVCSPACVDITLPAITAGSTAGLTLTYWEDSSATIPLVSPASVCDSTWQYYVVGTSATVPACTDTAPILVRIDDVPVAINITETCNPTATKYVVTFDITGGDAASYSVTGGLGTLTGSTFTSDSILQGAPYSFNLDDMFACGPRVINGIKACACATDAGTMNATAIAACENSTITATHNADSTADANDVMSFILHTNSGNTAGTIYDTSLTSTFSYDSAMTYGATYYISSVVGNNQGNGYVDLNDPCLSVANGTPVVWNKLPQGSPATDSLCADSIVVEVPVTDVFGATYTWNGSNGSSGSGNVIDTVTNAGATPLVVTYTITPTGPAPTFCLGPTFDIDVSVMPKPTGVAATDTVCSGTLLAIVPAANIAGTSFTWSGSNASGGTSTINDSPTNFGTVRDSVLYTVSPVAPAPTSCPGPDFEIKVYVDPYPIGTPDRDTVCAGTLLAINPVSNVAGTGYNWSGSNASAGATVINDTPANPGTTRDSVIYTVTPTGPAPTQCVGGTFEVVVQVDPIPSGIAMIDTSCSGDAVSILPSASVAGSSFTWVGDNASAGNDTIIDNPLNTGTANDSVVYAVSPIGPSPTNCAGSAFDVTVIIPPVPDVVLSGDSTICDGGSANLLFDLSGNGPFDVVYYNNSSASNDTLWNIANGHILGVSPADTAVYTAVAVFDNTSLACPGTAVGTATVNVVQLPTITVSGTTGICNGDSALLTFTMTGQGPYSFSYTANGMPANVDSVNSPYSSWVNPTSTTTYTAVSVIDHGGPDCSNAGAGSATVTVNNLPTANLSGTASVCENDTTALPITLTGTGPFDVTIASSIGDTFNLTGITNGHLLNVSPSSSANYSIVEVTDSNVPTCSATNMTGNPAVTVNTRPTATITGDTTICPGDSAELTFSFTGTGPFEVIFQDNHSNTDTLSGISNGFSNTVFPANPTTIYSLLSVEDSSVPTCFGSVSGSATVNMPDYSGSVSTQDNLCFGDCQGTITANILGGTNAGSYTYTWAAGIAGLSDSTATGLCKGTYGLSVTDDIGCVLNFPAISISHPTLVTVDTMTTPSHCFQADGTATLLVSGGSSNGTYNYQWDAAAGNQTTAAAAGLIAGTYTVVVSDSNNCDTTVVVTIYDEAGVSASLATAPQTQCFGDCNGSAQVAASGGHLPYGFQWYASNFSPLTGETSNLITGLCMGTYHCIITDANNCTDTVNIVVQEYPDLVLSLTPNTTICALDTITLVANASGGNGGPYNYIWSQTSNLSSSQDVSPNQQTTYSVFADDGTCISATSSVTISLHPELEVQAFVLLEDTICPGYETQLHAEASGGLGTSTYQYSWNRGIGSMQSPTISQDAPVLTYEVTVSDGGCNVPVTDVVTVWNYTLPNTALMIDVDGNCQPVTASFQRIEDNSVTSCLWDFGDGETSNDCELESYTYEVPGTYYAKLKLTGEGGCVDSSAVDSVVVDPIPTANFHFSPRNATILEPYVQFSNRSKGNNTIEMLQWDFAGFETSFEDDPYITFPEDRGRDYPVELVVMNEFLCRDTARQYVSINNELLLYVPSAFSPDGDGINDVFISSAIGVSEDFFKLQVFNRWGELVFETFDQTIPWDGHHIRTQKPCAPGVYVWKIEYDEDTNDIIDVHSLTGHVTLLR
jgi:gliding motility-associated-like protein